MKPTELLQKIRKMRFEEAYGAWTQKRLSQEEAALLLGVCPEPSAVTSTVTTRMAWTA